jgi:pyridoxal phosphate enzyme (YggS family)
MLDATVEITLKDRLQALEERIRSACTRSGRGRDQVTLVCVTKTVNPEVAALLPALGYRDLGESRPQELWRKAAAISEGVCWHLIGHLQRNKIERSLPLADWIHSVDRTSLLQALDEEAARRQKPVQALLEVNVAREPNKHGYILDDLTGVVESLTGFQSVHIRGLMTMAPFEEDPEKCREVFVELRSARDRLQKSVPPPHSLEHLSMGMTNDFEVAIEEGATMIRVGTAIFSGLPGNES